MKITDEAKAYIQQAMEENQVSTLRFFGIAGCCGVNLGVSLAEAEENDLIEEVNGLQIAIQPEMKEQLNDVTLELEEEDGEMGLVLNGYNETSCC